MEIEIYPYKISRRTEYSKIKIFDIKKNEDLSDTPDGKKIANEIIKEYLEQKEHPEDYFIIRGKYLLGLTGKVKEDNIKNIFVPSGVEIIHKDAFEEEKMQFISLPDTLKHIKRHAFYKCTELSYIEIPDSVTKIEDGIFYWCENLKTAILPKNNTFDTITKNLFAWCTNLKNIYMSDNVKFIEDNAFCKCCSIENLKLSNSLQKIGTSAFDGCERLKEIILPESLNIIHNEAFSDCVALEKITIPNSVTTMGRNIFFACKNLEEVVLSNKLMTLYDYTFNECKKLKEIEIPDNISVLCDRVFYATEFNNLTLPKNLELISGYPFEQSKIKTLIFRHDLEKLEDIKKSNSNVKRDLISNSEIDKLIIDSSVKIITPEAFKYSGNQITTIDYQGTKTEFNKFKKNNKKLFNLFTSLKEINFVEKDKRREILNIAR